MDRIAPLLVQETAKAKMRIAFDTGGTFTDCVFVRDGRVEILKVPSTAQNPALAIAEALRSILAETKPRASLDLLCGTTVGTNALLERKGGRVALVTTAGFEDVVEIGRQARPRLYDFFVERPAPLVPAERRFGLCERVDAQGRPLIRPTPSDIAKVVRRVLRSRSETVAVCFLFSFENPAHERLMARALRRAGLAVSVSHEILPEFREFERTATTVMNAYLVPVMGRYLEEVERRVRRHSAPASRVNVHVMQSSGGLAAAKAVAREPVRTILSGPAGGVLGAQAAAAQSGISQIISFDMGGTSTDVSLVDDRMRTTNEATVADLPVAVPVLDIHTVGAGGGSIARFDRAGALRVGPESSGADPGPICYGRGKLPTVTDAHVVLGRIPSSGLLGGDFPVDAEHARSVFDRAKGPMRSTIEFAQGIIDVANATMEKAIRVISIERGHDPADYTLVAFGGAGPLHACELATALRMPCVLVPKFPGALSALGIYFADVVKDFSQTVRMRVASLAEARAAMHGLFARLERGALAAMRKDGWTTSSVRLFRSLDLRYVGQAYELTVGAEGNFVREFHRAHELRYGYCDANRQVEIVNLRVRLILPNKSVFPRRPPNDSLKEQAPIIGRQVVHFQGARLGAAHFDRAKLRPGHRFSGPALVTEYSASTFVPPGWRGQVDAAENMLLERGK